MPESESNEVMAQGRFLRMVRRGRWEYVERPNTEGAVAVIAVTDAGELVLIEQHRVPLGRACVELPAGLAGDLDDDPDESFAQAARRELLEETGFHAETVEHLFPAVTSPGLTSESIDLYRATGLTRRHDGGGVDHEAITVRLVPIDAVDAWLAERSAAGLAVDIKVYAAAALAKAWREPH
ncbi:MAG: NUDIX hydrolase [Phycisphaeraceae bacterium]